MGKESTFIDDISNVSMNIQAKEYNSISIKKYGNIWSNQIQKKSSKILFISYSSRPSWKFIRFLSVINNLVRWSKSDNAALLILKLINMHLFMEIYLVNHLQHILHLFVIHQLPHKKYINFSDKYMQTTLSSWIQFPHFLTLF